MLIKALWNNALAAKAQLSKQSSFASLLSTNLPMGNKKGEYIFYVVICVYFSNIEVIDEFLIVSVSVILTYELHF